MGILIGDVGISFDDFVRLRSEEIDAILKTYGERKKEEACQRWEVMRLQTFMTISPFCKDLSHPKKLLPFPWDNEEEEEHKEAAPLSLEERRENERRTRAALGW